MSENLTKVNVTGTVRQLNKVDELSQKVLFIGFGGCGGNLAREWATGGMANNLDHKYSTLAFNTASQDILAIHEHVNSHTYGTVDGCSRSREISKAQLIEINPVTGKGQATNFLTGIMTTIHDKMKEEISVTRSKVSTNLRAYDMIIVAASAGGGTGSGAIPIILDRLRKIYTAQAGIPVVGLIVLPSETDKIHRSNALAVVKALTSKNKAGIPLVTPGPTIAIDNGKFHTDSPIADKRKINDEIVNLLKYVLNFDKISNLSQNIDGSTKLSLFTDPKFMMIGSMTCDSNVDKHDIIERFRESVNSSPCIVDLESSPDKLGVIFELKDDFYTTGIVEDIMNAYAPPKDVYIRGYFEPVEIEGPITTPATATTPAKTEMVKQQRNKITYIYTGMEYPEKWKEKTQSIIDNTLVIKKDVKREEFKDNSKVYETFKVVTSGTNTMLKTTIDESMDELIDSSEM